MIDFPSSPSAGQVHTDSTSGLSWAYNGTVWKPSPGTYAAGAVLGNPAISAAAPAATSTARMIRASLGDGTAGQAILSGGAGIDPAWGTVSGGGGSSSTPPAGLPLATGRWYGVPIVGSLTTGSAAANTLYATPLYVPGDVTVTQIAGNVATAVAGNMELGIYADGGGYPGTRLLDAGAISTNSLGMRAITGLSTPISAGWVWLVMACSVTTSVSVTPSTTTIAVMNTGMASLGTGQTQYTGFTGAWTFAAGALPSTFPSPTPGGTGRPIVAIQI